MKTRRNRPGGISRTPAVVPALLSMLAIIAQPLHAGILSGMVEDVSGRPAAGAFVKVKSADSRVIFMVVSGPDGRYETPDLPPGAYSAQAFGPAHQGGPAGPIAVDAHAASLDVTMSAPRKVYPPPKKEYTEEEFAAMMPGGEGKDLLLAKCTVCHSAGHFVSRRKTPKDWRDTAVKMRYRWNQMPMLIEAYTARTGISPEPISDRELKVISDYLVEHYHLDEPPLFGPPHPDSHLPMATPEGAEARFVAMEMDLGESLVGSYDVDRLGIIWVSEKTSGILGRLDPKTLDYRRVHIPPVNVTEEFFGGVSIDPQGMVWFSSNVVPGAQWFQYDPESDQIVNTYDVPLPTRPGGDIFFNSFAFPRGGSVWSVVTAFHSVYKLDPATREVKKFPMREGAHPFGMTIGGDGNIWYAGDNDSQLIQIDPETDEMTPVDLKPGTGPRRLATDADGNVWAASIDRGALVKLDIRTRELTEFYPPSAGTIQGIPVEKYLQGVDVDTGRDLVWFSEYEAIKLGRLDPRTGDFLEFPLITAESQPWIVKVDPTNPDRVWWNSRNGRIGYLELTD